MCVCVCVSIDVLREGILQDGTTSVLANTFAMSALNTFIEGQFLISHHYANNTNIQMHIVNGMCVYSCTLLAISRAIMCS